MALTLNHSTASYGKMARNLLREAIQPSEVGARAALESFYYAFNHRSIDVLTKIWLHHPLIQLNNPLGGILRGYEPIQDLYTQIFNGTVEVWVEFTDIVEYFSGETAIFAGQELGEFAIAGQTTPLKIRTTRCFQYFQREGWKQVHHHGSIDNVELLKAYQTAVNRQKM